MSEQLTPNIKTKELIDHLLKVDFFIDLKVSLDDLQRFISLINILALMSTETVNPNEVPILSFNYIESDSIIITFKETSEYLDRLKEIIIDVNNIKKPENIPEGHYLIPILYKLFQYLKEGKLKSSRYLLLNVPNYTQLEEQNGYLFKWIKKITALNGKLLDEKPVFEDKEDVSDAYNANKEELSNSVFSGLSLDGVDLSNANLKDSEFIKTNLMKANLEFANLENTDFTEANMIGANMANVNMKNSNLSMAQLIEANLSEADLSNSTINSAFLIGANLRRSTLIGSNLSSIVLSRADASRARFDNCISRNANMVSINAVEANFTDSDFSNSDLSTSRLQGINITNTILAGSKLLEANMGGITQYYGADFTSCDWWNASEISEDLLNFLRNVFPCSMEEDQRLANYKDLYGKPPSEDIIKRQYKMLGIHIKEEEPEPEPFPELEIDDPFDLDNIDSANLTPEYLEKLAQKMMDEPL